MLENVFSDGQIGSLQTDNRIVLPSMNTRLPSEDGRVTEETLDYYRERARGGTGLLTFESTYPCHPHPNRYRITDDSYVAGLSSVVDVVHEEGTNLAVQMNIHRASADQHEPLAPSPLTTPDGTDVPAITREQLASLVKRFADGAKRAREAGFDGIEIHAASGYLIHQFLSPHTNDREDSYGGSLWNRTKLARDVLAAVRDRVGTDFPVWFRISGKEFLDGGIGITEARENARVLAEAGSDAVHVTAGHHWNAKSTPSGYAERAVYADIAAEIREAVSVPVITVGRINDPAVAERVLAAGKADFVAMARAHLADPHFLRKAKEGEADRIRPCVGGLEGCYDGLNGAPVTCTVNARVGREGEAFAPVDEPTEIAVVGGGPAGMEVARVAGARGHEVTIYERSAELGGQLSWAAHAPAKREYETLVRYYRAELEAHDVTVNCGTDIDETDLADLEADEVVLATGSAPSVPSIPGLSEAAASGFVVRAQEALTDPDPSADRVVVLGAGEEACDAAEYLVETGRAVTIVAPNELLPERVLDTSRFGYRKRTLARFDRTAGLTVLTDARVDAIDEESVLVTGPDGDRRLECDRLVLATERTPRRGLAGAGDVVSRVVGDADGGGDLYGAIHDGTAVGNEL